VGAVRRSSLATFLLLLCLSCASARHGGGPDDARPPDDGGVVPTPPRPAAEVVTGAGRLHGGGRTMDVEVGVWADGHGEVVNP
jgi:hypothetical protein